jgi:broad specificity phosphatase PhoE
MVTLFFLRHGESEYNAQGLIQGQTDISLSQKGMQQARLLARRLQKTTKVSHIISSDLKRTQQTCDIFREYFSVPYVMDSRWREIFWGNWEKQNWQELRKKAEFKKYLSQWYTYKEHQGESWQDVTERVKPCLQEMFNDSEEKQILVVTHGGIIRVCLLELLGLPKQYYSFVIENASITEFEKKENRWIAKRINDFAHVEITDTENTTRLI